MKSIIKSPKPIKLTVFKSSKDALYCNIPTLLKNELKSIMIADQNHICCYCMSRISIESSSIEHFLPQSTHSPLQLDWDNLFAVCKGDSELEKNREIHCDKSKENNILNFSLLTLNESNFQYNVDGTIFHQNNAINNDLNILLNLNNQILKDNRKKLLLFCLNDLKKEQSNYTGDKKNLYEKFIAKYSSLNEGKHLPHFMIAIYFLRDKART